MKLIYNTLLAAVLLTAVSCSKEIGISKAPDFNVTTASSTYKVGETIKFDITGKADFITFYSGDLANDYSFKDGHIIDIKDKGAVLSFTSSLNGTGTQANQLSIQASTDFNGDYSSIASVRAATWTNITSRFVLGTDLTFKASTVQDVSDLFVAGKPLYIAYKYVTKPQVANGLVRNWYLESFLLNSKATLGTKTLTISDLAHAAFTIVDENKVNAPARSVITSTRISLLGNVLKLATDPIFDPANPIFDPLNPIYDPLSPLYQPTSVLPVYVPFDPTSPYNDPLSEHWAISSAIFADKVDLGPDRGVPIKKVEDPVKTLHTFAFTKPGTYTVTFVAADVTVDETKSVVKQIQLTITQ